MHARARLHRRQGQYQAQAGPGLAGKHGQAVTNRHIGDFPLTCRGAWATRACLRPSAALFRAIRFGASFKAVEWDWSEWLAKFEQLLSGLDGMSATVHLQTELVGDPTYKWLRTNHAPGTDRRYGHSRAV